MSKKKLYLKNVTAVETSDFDKKTDLANLKSEIEKLDIEKLEKVSTGLSSLESTVDILDVDKLVSVPFDSSKLNNVVKNDLVKRDV